MDDSRVALLDAYHDIRDRFNKMRTDYWNLMKLTQKCQHCHTVLSECNSFQKIDVGHSSQSILSLSTFSMNSCSHEDRDPEKLPTDTTPVIEHVLKVPDELNDICSRLEKLSSLNSSLAVPLSDIVSSLKLLSYPEYRQSSTEQHVVDGCIKSKPELLSSIQKSDAELTAKESLSNLAEIVNCNQFQDDETEGRNLCLYRLLIISSSNC